MSVRLLCSSLFFAGSSYFLYQKYRPVTLNAHEFNVHIEKKNLKTPARIAVIGAGIGGSSASYFLSKTFGSSIHVDVYEKSDRIGGRMQSIELDGHEIEAGGTIIHDSNKYMVYFTKEMGLEPFKAMGTSKLGIYNGKEFVSITSTNMVADIIKMIWRYGILSLWNLDSSLKTMLKDFVNVYSLQNEGKAFNTVPDLLRSMAGGDKFIEYSQQTAREVMKKNGLSDLLIDEVVTAITRCNYGQDASVNGFTGYVSLAGGSNGELWAVKNGNYLVCKRLLEYANATIYFNHSVSNIDKMVDENGISKYFVKTNDKGHSKIPYDVVIVAAPLEVPKCYFDCVACSDWPKQDTLGRYQQTIASFIQAYANYKYFGFDRKEDLPAAILTTESKDLVFSSLATQKNTTGEDIDPPIYKVFSREPLTKESIENLFDVSEKEPKVLDVHWLAYPQYTPPERFTPFKLDDAVFYVNSIERAASAMEMSAVGGRNTALLAQNYLIDKENS